MLWHDPLEGGNTAELQADDDLVPEAADISMIPSMAHVRDVRLWHECQMTGQIYVVRGQPTWMIDPEQMNVREKMFALPIRADGWVKAYVVEATDETMLFVRFGVTRPTQWRRLAVPDVRNALLVSQSFLDSSETDVMLRRGFADVSENFYTSLMKNIPVIATWPTDDGGTPGVWVLGVDEDERVTALLISDNPEVSVFPARSPALDSSLWRR